MPLLKRRRVFAAKVETTIGTAESLTGAEGVYNAYNVMIQPKISMTPRESQGGFGMLTSVPQGLAGVAALDGMERQLSQTGPMYSSLAAAGSRLARPSIRSPQLQVQRLRL